MVLSLDQYDRARFFQLLVILKNVLTVHLLRIIANNFGEFVKLFPALNVE